MTGTGQKPFWGTEHIVTPMKSDKPNPYLSAIPPESEKVRVLQENNERLQKLLDEAIEMAQFYGNYDNHIHPTSKDTCLTAIDKDAGFKARKFLEELKK